MRNKQSENSQNHITMRKTLLKRECTCIHTNSTYKGIIIYSHISATFVWHCVVVELIFTYIWSYVSWILYYNLWFRWIAVVICAHCYFNRQHDRTWEQLKQHGRQWLLRSCVVFGGVVEKAVSHFSQWEWWFFWIHQNGQLANMAVRLFGPYNQFQSKLKKILMITWR